MTTPVILSEVSVAYNGAASWTPLECLQSLVAEIEQGETAPIQLMVIFRQRNQIAQFRVAGPGSGYEKVGMVQAGLYRYLRQGEGQE